MTGRQFFLSFLGAGFLRPAPGTWGSLAAFPAAWVVWTIGGPVLLVLVGAALFWAGVVAAGREITSGGDHDPGWIVVDEVVGQWIAILPVAIGAAHVGLDPLRLWPGLVSGFVFFRLFDIWKPWLVGRADRRGDALGLMLDDVWAGIFAALVGVVLAGLSHGVMAL